MKNLIIIITAVLLANVAIAQKGVETVKLQTSAVCEMCKETIENQLAFTKGVTAAKLDLESFVVTVSYKSKKTTVSDLKKAINAVGYDADESKPSKEEYEKLHHCCRKDSH